MNELVVGAVLLLLGLAGYGLSAVRGQRDEEEVPETFVRDVFREEVPEDEGWHGPPPDAVGLQLDLLRAGIYASNGVKIFLGLRLVAVVVLPLAVAACRPDVSETLYWALLAGSAALGWVSAAVALDVVVRRRLKRIAASFPDALDLMVSCIESGLTFESAMQFVAKQFDSFVTDLADELYLVTDQVMAGISMEMALEGMSSRCKIDEVQMMVATVIQNAARDADLGQALRTYARISREKRFAAAEERAGRVSTKLTVIMVLFILPPMVVMLASPAGIELFYEISLNY